MQKCPFCNRDMMAGAQYCTYCMQLISPKKNVYTVKKKSRLPLLLTSALLLAALSAAIGVAILVTRPAEKVSPSAIIPGESIFFERFAVTYASFFGETLPENALDSGEKTEHGTLYRFPIGKSEACTILAGDGRIAFCAENPKSSDESKLLSLSEAAIDAVYGYYANDVAAAFQDDRSFTSLTRDRFESLFPGFDAEAFLDPLLTIDHRKLTTKEYGTDLVTEIVRVKGDDSVSFYLSFFAEKR